LVNDQGNYIQHEKQTEADRGAGGGIGLLKMYDAKTPAIC
jgi:hypothetical protein